jgi:hypothetical protein
MELGLLESLVSKRDLLAKQQGETKMARIEGNALTYWLATNNARDSLCKQDYYARYDHEQRVAGSSFCGARLRDTTPHSRAG